MSKRLEGKVAVVTGGGGGLGRHIALELAEEGAKVVINDIGIWTPDKPKGTQPADLVVNEIRKAGGEAVVNYDSVATMAGGENVIKAAITNFGRIDILVCCAGNYKKSLIYETTEEDWDSIMSVHAKGLFSCAKYASQYMKEQKSGTIVTISSTAVFSNSAKSPMYGAAKAAVYGLSACLAVQLGQYGVTVNCIVPSAPTQLFPGKGDGTAGADKFIGLPGVSNPKLAGPDMIAPFVVYLATNEARNINGQVFWVSGPHIALMSQFRPLMMLTGSKKWTIDELIETVPVTFGPKITNPLQAPPPGTTLHEDFAGHK